MVTRNGVSEHVKVYGEWFIMRIVGVREGSNKRVANENMGSTDLGEVIKLGKGTMIPLHQMRLFQMASIVKYKYSILPCRTFYIQ
ncbi:hypothetical protein TorRG33x02_075740 [Trema orientale]|uniref:Uncharacterized protein n=1 Tax=Trema orientale TaxID=63057 RepID=A0A2P5FFM4_TREOI|nr:hypothetical protein TorRG33x02_075740 [Trema orientale]